MAMGLFFFFIVGPLLLLTLLVLLLVFLLTITLLVILPLVARLDRPLVLKTWDRTVIPVPFRSAAVEIGPPLRVGRHEAGAEFAGPRARMAAFFDVEEVNP